MARRGRTAPLMMGLIAALMAWIALCSGQTAFAHAELSSTEPSATSPLAHCPQRVTLHFTEAVASGGLQVSINAHPVTIVSSSADSRSFVVDAGQVCPASSLALDWRTVSADDGHVATDAVTFHVDAGAATSGDTGARHQPGLATPAGFRALGYGALALLVGGLFFLVVVWPEGADVRRPRALLSLSVVLGLVGSVGGLWATMQRAGGMSLHAALGEPFGREYLALAALWLLATALVVDLLQRGRVVLGRLAWRVSCVAIGGAMVVVESMTAHAFASSHRTIGLLDDVVHVVAMSIWVGGLLMLTLCVLPRRRLAELDVVVARFSRIAKRSVGAAVASGLVLLALVVLPTHHIWGTRYAATLAIKLAALLAALIVALGSEQWVRGRRRGTRMDDPRSIAAIVRSVSTETVLAVAILAAAGALASSSPGV